MEKPQNPFRQVLEKSKHRIYILAFIMGAIPFLLVVLLRIASYAGIIIIVCVVLGAILRIAQIARRRY